MGFATDNFATARRLGRLVSFRGIIMDVFQKGDCIHSWQCGKAMWLCGKAESFQLGFVGEKEYFLGINRSSYGIGMTFTGFLRQ